MIRAALRPGTCAEAGLSEAMPAAAAAVLDQGIAEGVFPGGVAIVARRGVVAAHVARGDAQILPERRPAGRGTWYDLASLTKVVGTLPAVLSACAEGRIDLDEPLRAVFPALSGAGRERITWRHLLSHTAGYPAWRMFYLDVRGRARVLEAILATPLDAPPGARVVYSDTGFLLLGLALERLHGARQDAIYASRVASPLGTADTAYLPHAARRDRCAASESGNAFERARAGSAGARFPWRTHVLRGEVHDGNAFYAMDGVAGHAGLFATAWDVAVSAQQWLRPGDVVPPPLALEAIRPQTAGADGPARGLGWMLRGDDAFFAALGPRSFGHTGFTGTAVAADPDLDLVLVLLTNRVHPSADSDAIHDVRARFVRTIRGGMGA